MRRGGGDVCARLCRYIFQFLSANLHEVRRQQFRRVEGEGDPKKEKKPKVKYKISDVLGRGVCSRGLGGLWKGGQQEWEPIRGRPTVRGKRTYGGRPGQRVEEQGTWAAQKHSEAGDGRPVDRGVWTANTVKRPRQRPAHPRYANYWAPLTRKRHILPHPAQPQHTNYWAPRTRKRHQQEHRPQRPTERSDPTQHAKGRTGDRPGPRKGATTRRNVTQGGAQQRRQWSNSNAVRPRRGRRGDARHAPRAERLAGRRTGRHVHIRTRRRLPGPPTAWSPLT